MAHKGHGQKITRKAEQAIAALLKHPSIDEAVKECGVSKRTLWRWLQQEDFRAAYKAAQRAIVDDAIKDMQAATKKAVETLTRNLSCGNFFAENTAAQAIITHALKAIEIEELQERIERLEQLLPGVRRA